MNYENLFSNHLSPCLLAVASAVASATETDLESFGSERRKWFLESAL